MSDKFEANVQTAKRVEETVLLSKHRDYGPDNIARSPGGPLNGLRVRLHDKLARLNHLVDSGADPEHESLVDTALDIANYGTIMGLVLRGQWPGVETPATTESPNKYLVDTSDGKWYEVDADTEQPRPIA